MLLARLKQAEMRVGFGIGWMCPEEGAPRLFAFGNLPLLFKRKGGLAEVGSPG